MSQENQEPSQAEESAVDELLNSRRSDPVARRARYAYLFHLWAEPRRGDKAPIWRFSLEEVDTGVRHGFGNWDAFVAFLQERMDAE